MIVGSWTSFNPPTNIKSRNALIRVLGKLGVKSAIGPSSWSGHYRRVGDSMEVRYMSTQLGSIPAGAVELPPGYNVDTTKCPNNVQVGFGNGTSVQASVPIAGWSNFPL